MSRPSVEQALRVAMLGTTDGDFIDPDSEVPAGEMYRLAVEAIPAVLALFADEPGSRAEYHYARGLAAGRMEAEPETITTVAELDALPVGSVVLDADEDAWQKRVWQTETVWVCTDRYIPIEPDDLDGPLDGSMPATVLHRPTEGDDR